MQFFHFFLRVIIQNDYFVFFMIILMAEKENFCLFYFI